jgi:hypothetical protein
MNLVDLLITVIVVAVLLAIALGVVTYLVFKLRRAHRPPTPNPPADGSWYFVRYSPDGQSNEV